MFLFTSIFLKKTEVKIKKVKHGWLLHLHPVFDGLPYIYTIRI